MFNKSMQLSYYLFSLSNLIAAFGGGLILGKGVSIIDLPWLQGGSILAFFIGTIVGLFFMQIIPKKSSNQIARFFSMGCGITSLILFYIYQNYASETKLNGNIALIFFALLSIRFGLWFYSRVMRASQAAGHKQSIAWVELGYYSGMILGLIIWKLLRINVVFGTALIIDACCQFIAGILDYRGNTLSQLTISQQTTDTVVHSKISSVKCNTQWCWKLASAVISITIGIQVVIFHSAHYVSEVFSSYIIGVFYFGVAVAAFICNRYKVYITWNDNNVANIQANNTAFRINLSLIACISVISVIFAIYYINFKDALLTTYIANELLICLFVFIAAFIYEIISLTILDRLGYEENILGRSGMIIRTYGLMGLGAALSLWLLGLIDNHFTSSIITVVLSLVFSILLILKRSTSVHKAQIV